MAGPQCCMSPPPRNHPPVGVGRLDAFKDLTAYVTGSLSLHAPAAIILLSDIYGFDAPLLRKLADKVAEAGYLVVVPDYFDGNPFEGDLLDSSILKAWLNNHTPEKGFEDGLKIIDVLKSKGITKFGAAGFCWGAKGVVKLATTGDIKAGVLLHPACLTNDDFKEIKVPMALLAAEIDEALPPELVKQFETILSAKPEVDSFVHIYPGVVHGWTTRYDENDEISV